MSTRYPQLTFGDRALRQERMIEAYRDGLSSRQVARMFGMSDSYVRDLARQAGIARPVGAPKSKSNQSSGRRAG